MASNFRLCRAGLLAAIASCAGAAPLFAQAADRVEPNRGAALDLASQDPKVALERMKVADGYEVNLFASEVEFPDLAKPLQMTFDTRGHTMMGVSPEAAAEALVALGVDAIGGNCGNGPDELLPVIERMRAIDPEAVLVAKSNAGMPELVDMRAVYRADPPSMAAYGVELHAAGARIVGACCGSSPDHLRAMHAALVPAS